MPQPLPRLEADYEQQWSQGGRDKGTFVIEVEGKCIGQCALFNFDTVGHTAELGIAIGDKDYWGRGLGRETIRLLVHYGFQYHNLRKVWLRVLSKNERAIRAYTACGFVEEGRQRAHVWSDGAHDDLLLLGLLRDEWSSDLS
jgi:RimJ/RimL family protein N-acetyltransferase